MPSKKGDLFFGWGQDDNAKKFEELPTTNHSEHTLFIHKTKTGRKKIFQQSNNPRIDRTALTVPCRKLCPSDALFVAGAVGVALRCRRSDAAEVEPWSLGGSMWGV